MTEAATKKLEEKLKQFEENATTDENKVTFSVKPYVPDGRKRNLILDEERFEDTFLKCLICRETYDEGDKLPKMLPCHHTFCLDCLRQMFRVEGEYRQTLTSAFRSMPVAVKISCPTCREGLIASEAEIRRLPNDHTVLELVSFVKRIGKQDVPYCDKHQLQPLNFFCEPCMAPVCCDCTVIDHKERNGHLVINLEEAMEKYSPTLDVTLGDIAKQKKAMEEKRQTLVKGFDNVEQIQRELAVQIRQTFDRIRDAVDARERELFELSEHQIERKQNSLKDIMKQVTDRETILDQQREKLEQAKERKDLVHMFELNEAAKDTLAAEVDIPATKPSDDFSVSFQFNSRQEASIRQTITNFGDVTFKFE
ncbi:hypothetical protein CHS0354_014323 [Potamilus streckersoni]|uniref:Uncharacterized protein n=1 Tax=Potamilus streckersoni TaxID=2493646 RepID=A0AAE0SKL3_9BIVA|nr:hypothetical protein CHS0354_014323 [Potamilus streckersoni]